MAHMVMCVVNMWLGSAIWFGSRSAYAISGLLMLIWVKMYVMSCFWIKAGRKMTKYSINASFTFLKN